MKTKYLLGLLALTMSSAAFAADPVISTQDTRRKSEPEFQQLDVIFDQHESTHAVLVRAQPLALLLVNMPPAGSKVA